MLALSGSQFTARGIFFGFVSLALALLTLSSLRLALAHELPASFQQRGDSAVLVKYLRARKEKLRRVAAHRDSLWAIIVGRDPERLVLHYLKIASGKVYDLHAPDSIGTFIPQEVRWVSIRKQDAPIGLFVREDYTSAAVVGSGFLRLDHDSLTMVFKDSTNTCRAAEIKNLASDGEPMLIAYEDDPSGGYCDSDCHDQLETKYHSTVAWPHVYVWKNDRWADAEQRTPTFYASIAQTYREIASWMDSAEGKKACSATWASSKRFLEWSQRADSLATNRS